MRTRRLKPRRAQGTRERIRARFARMPLRWRLALSIFGLLAVVLAAVGTLVTLTEEQALLRNQATALYDQARLVGSPTGAHGGVWGRGQPPPVANAPTSVSLQTQVLLTTRLGGVGTVATLLSPSGVWLAGGTFVPGAPGAVAVPPQPDSASIQRALNERVVPDVYYTGHGADGQRWLYILLPVVDRASDGSLQTVALLQLSERTAAIDRAVAAMRLILFTGIAGALLLAATLATPLVAAALRPLGEMERASRQIAQGALSLRLKEPETDDEIGRLARSFNVMVAQLEEAFEQQKRFVSDVSHELRTPLTALGGGLEMLMLGADAGDPETQRRLLRGMYAETERMRRLVTDLLTLARLDEGRLPIRLGAVDVAALAREVCDQAEALAAGQEVVCETPEGALTAQADADRLREVLLNIVENALKHTPGDGVVTLSARAGARPGTVALEVGDTGEGIPAEALPHLFDRFYRADFARARSGQGTSGSGLGLSIAKSLVEAQGGTIAIASEQGRGTVVTLTLRAAAPATESAAWAAEPPEYDDETLPGSAGAEDEAPGLATEAGHHEVEPAP